MTTTRGGYVAVLCFRAAEETGILRLRIDAGISASAELVFDPAELGVGGHAIPLSTTGLKHNHIVRERHMSASPLK